MNLYITYENLKQKISVPDNTDFTLFIDTFYTEQIEWAKKHGRDTSKIRKRTPQEILSIFSSKELKNYNEFRDHNQQPLQSVNEDDELYYEGFTAKSIIDNSQHEKIEKDLMVSELHDKLIAGGLSEEQYQLILTCIDRQEEERLEDVADFMGISVDALNMRLQRARSKFEKITGKPLVF